LLVALELLVEIVKVEYCVTVIVFECETAKEYREKSWGNERGSLQLLKF